MDDVPKPPVVNKGMFGFEWDLETKKGSNSIGVDGIGPTSHPWMILSVQA